MDPFLAFLAAIIFVSLVIPRLGPFLSLVISAIAFGLLVGMDQELLGYVSTGLSRIFSSLAIVVFSGALLAEYLRRTESLDRIVADLGGLANKSQLVSGAAGYLISLPVMCSITAYMILEPVVKDLAGKESEGGIRALFMTAACSIISFNLIYPSPVMITLSSGLQAAPYDLLVRCIPISLILFALAYILMKHFFPEKEKAGSRVMRAPAKMSRSRAWAPLLVPIALILLGSLQEQAYILADPGIALLLGAMLCLALERKKMKDLIHVASRRSGVILLDLCGAGAFGYVVAQSGLGQEIYNQGQFLPALLLPFLVSAALQLAQGSRVVTAAVSAQILAGYPLPAVTLALLIAAGAFMFSYVTDPYFWLIKSTTGASMKQTALGYTLPLSLLGLAAFALAAISSIL
ncbi:MAG: GntP family permease [Methanotrichaceae archaeon]|nr:GntP family permease [Methanotrichaceae archaeon]